MYNLWVQSEAHKTFHDSLQIEGVISMYIRMFRILSHALSEKSL